MLTENTLLTREDAAAHLKISKHTLNRWRVTGEGPPFIKYGPRLVRYLITAWMAGRKIACSPTPANTGGET